MHGLSNGDLRLLAWIDDRWMHGKLRGGILRRDCWYLHQHELHWTVYAWNFLIQWRVFVHRNVRCWEICRFDNK